MFAAEPGSAVRIMLLLPDRDDFLDPLDRIAAGLERGVAVRRGDADDDACLTDRERADTVDYGDVVDAPPLADLVTNLRHGELGGRGIRLVFEMGNRATAAVVANRPDERRNGAGAGVSNERFGQSGIERFRLNAIPRLTTTTHRRNQCQLIAIVKLMVVRHIGF